MVHMDDDDSAVVDGAWNDWVDDLQNKHVLIRPLERLRNRHEHDDDDEEEEHEVMRDNSRVDEKSKSHSEGKRTLLSSENV